MKNCLHYNVWLLLIVIILKEHVLYEVRFEAEKTVELIYIYAVQQDRRCGLNE